jgi:hypothetical protein
MALSLGSLAAILTIAGSVAFPPAGAIDKLVYVIAGLAVLAPVVFGLHARGAFAADFLLPSLAVLWLAWPRLQSGYVADWLLAAGIAAAGWLLLARTRADAGHPGTAAVLLVSAAALSVVAFYGASIRLAEIGLGLFAALAAVLVIGFLSRRSLGGNGAATYLAAAFLFLLAVILALYTVSAPPALVLLLAAALAGRWADGRAESTAATGATRGQGDLALAGHAALTALVPALAAVGIAVSSSPGAPVY